MACCRRTVCQAIDYDGLECPDNSPAGCAAPGLHLDEFITRVHSQLPVEEGRVCENVEPLSEPPELRQAWPVSSRLSPGSLHTSPSQPMRVARLGVRLCEQAKLVLGALRKLRGFCRSPSLPRECRRVPEPMDPGLQAVNSGALCAGDFTALLVYLIRLSDVCSPQRAAKFREFISGLLGHQREGMKENPLTREPCLQVASLASVR